MISTLYYLKGFDKLIVTFMGYPIEPIDIVNDDPKHRWIMNCLALNKFSKLTRSIGWIMIVYSATKIEFLLDCVPIGHCDNKLKKSFSNTFWVMIRLRMWEPPFKECGIVGLWDCVVKYTQFSTNICGN